MRLRRLVTKEAVLLSGVLLTAASCSFIFDTDQVQCEIKDDCAGFDPDPGVRDVACVQGICEYVDLNPTTTSPSTTGSAGAGGAPECTENEDCIPGNYGNPAICRDEKCIPLDTGQCPVIVGAGDNNEHVSSPKEPFIFGAMTLFGDPVLEATAFIANLEYAIDAVNGKTRGGYNYLGARRPFIAVVCSSKPEDVPAGMEHLVKTLGVPGIVTTQTAGLLEAFENEDYGARANNIFMLSTSSADSTLTSLETDPDGLFWHMLGDGVDQGLAYKPLVAQAEAYLRAQRSIPEDEKLRVVMVVSDTQYVKDIATVITSTVEFNGQSVVDNANDDCGDDIPCFERVNIPAITAEVPVPNVDEAFDVIMAHEPHLVLAITFNEFLLDDLLPRVEAVWDIDKGNRSLPPPMYLFSPRILRSTTLALAQEYETPPGNNPAFIPLRQRILGVAFAGADDTSLYEEYLHDFEREYQHLGISLASTENFYDAANYMMFAIHGGVAINNLTGLNVSEGMIRLLGPGRDYEVLRSDPNAIITELRTGDQDGYLTLHGTMGPPDFRPTGARVMYPAIYCIDLDPDGTNNAMAFYPDVLKYNPDNESLSSPSGEDPCSIDGFLGEP